MAGTKISELTELTTPTGEEELVYAKDGQNGKIKVKNLPSGGGVASVLSYKGTTSAARSKSYSRPSGANYCMWFSTAADSSDIAYGAPCYGFTSKPASSTATRFYNQNGPCYMEINNSTLTIQGKGFWTITIVFLK